MQKEGKAGIGLRMERGRQAAAAVPEHTLSQEIFQYTKPSYLGHKLYSVRSKGLYFKHPVVASLVLS